MSRQVIPEDYPGNRRNARRFVRDMIAAGLKPYHYRRYFWEGPAVNVDYLCEAADETSVSTQHDQMGLDVVVYPVQSAKLTEKGEARLAKAWKEEVEA